MNTKPSPEEPDRIKAIFESLMAVAPPAPKPQSPPEPESCRIAEEEYKYKRLIPPYNFTKGHLGRGCPDD